MSGKSCIQKLSELNQAAITNLIPTLVLIDIPYNDQLQDRPFRETREPSPGTQLHVDGVNDDYSKFKEAYGLRLLQWVTSEIQYHSLSKLVIPVALVTIPEINSETTVRKLSNSLTDGPTAATLNDKDWAALVTPLDQVRTMSYLDVGAVDVLVSAIFVNY